MNLVFVLIPHKAYSKIDETKRDKHERVPPTTETDWNMTHPQSQNLHAGRHLQDAIEHATRLSEPRADRAFSPSWTAQAAQVGDLSVLLLALRR